MGRFINQEDLAPFADIDALKAQMMIDDAEAMAVLAAPGLATIGDEAIPSVRAVLRGALIRWHEAGSGALSQAQTDAVTQAFAPRRSMFWPSEVDQLRSICASTEAGKAFSVDTAPPLGGHSVICSVYFGGACSCGADIAYEPIYEVD